MGGVEGEALAARHWRRSIGVRRTLHSPHTQPSLTSGQLCASHEPGGVSEKAPASSPSNAARGRRPVARCIKCTRQMLLIASSGTESAGVRDSADGLASDLLHVLLIHDVEGDQNKSEGQSCPRCLAPTEVVECWTTLHQSTFTPSMVRMHAHACMCM